MTTVELLNQALKMAKQAGYEIRYEPLDGANSGACEVRGERRLFLNPSESPAEQLEVVLETLRLLRSSTPDSP